MTGGEFLGTKSNIDTGVSNWQLCLKGILLPGFLNMATHSP